MTDAGETTAALLDALERVREVRGSPALYDALAAEEPARVGAALARHPRHPLRPRMDAWLRARGAEPPADERPEAALARHGIDDLDAHLAAAAAREAALARSLAEARAEHALALRSASAYALVAALLAVLAIGGWVAALGGFPFPEPISPAPVTKRSAVPTEEP